MNQESVAAGVGLMVFCGLIVGSLDNFLRPILVGKDTSMQKNQIKQGQVNKYNRR